ncbi:hypothetical protein [uncultured Parolsenella sp.]|uniref:hypothetical protein n=1 Tax=uncultured Parolsenella sp. TaxID=2083008 RepID=UPI0025FBE6E0|nr:hypothetical protein [uncultured Parolsenella sp.]
MAHLTVQELSDLCDAMMDRMGLELLPAITKANREDTLEDLLSSLGMEDLLGDNIESREDLILGKVIVLGASAVNVEKLRSTAKKMGFDPKRFEFQLDYSRLKHFNFGKVRNTMGYVAIFAGPMPHKTPGAEEASSFLARVESNPDGYPPLIKLQASNDLKITNNSFKHALGQLSQLEGTPTRR